MSHGSVVADLSTSAKPGVAFLRDEAINAHLSGDGMRVRHLCQVVISYLTQSGSRGSQPALPSVRWAFSLLLYWSIDGTTVFAVTQALPKTRDGEQGKADRLLLQ